MEKVKQPSPPFNCVPSPNFAELLTEFDCSIALSTFQAGKLVFISPKDKNFLRQLLRTVPNCMGFDYKDGKLAVAAALTLNIFEDFPQLAIDYPAKPNFYDAMYYEIASYTTGRVDAHDVLIGKDSVYIVYTHANMICELNDGLLSKVWSPPIIEQNALEDRCHLNGICLKDGALAFATSLGNSNENDGWRKDLPSGGMLYNIQTNEVISNQLYMPHSPRMYKDKLLVLESAKERLVEVDQTTGKITPIVKLHGFLRGMHIHGDYALIGSSKLRKNSSVFKDLEIANKDIKAGVYIVHLPSGTAVGHALYDSTIDEIFEVKFIPKLRPNLLSRANEKFQLATMVGDHAYWFQPKKD